MFTELLDPECFQNIDPDPDLDYEEYEPHTFSYFSEKKTALPAVQQNNLN